MDDYISSLTEEERAQRRAQRAQARQAKIKARRRARARQLFPLILVAAAAVGGIAAFALKKEPTPTITPEQPVFSSRVPIPAAVSEPSGPYAPTVTENTVTLTDEITSQYAVVVDLQTDTIIAQKEADALISPASMTKVLTLLVGAERVADRLDDTFTMTIDITDYCYVNDCSVVGLEIGETVTVRELLYGTILPSGADASLGLATYVTGSHEAFVELMNEKLEELGLSDTAHFTNCVGLYDADHKCTITDMALILKAAMENDLCREVLKARTYDTAPTADHPAGQTLSNWFLRRIEDRDNGGLEIVAGKTGYVVQSGSCAVSCGEDSQGNRYIVATGNASGSWNCLYDHTALYHDFCAETEPST